MGKNILERALTRIGLIRDTDSVVREVGNEARAQFAQYHAHIVAQVGQSSMADHRSYGGKYPLGIPGTGYGRLLSHYDLRINARERYHDSTQARCLVDRFVDVVVGTGLEIEPTPQAELLGISSEEAETWSRNVATHFKLWANSKDQHRSETMTFQQAQSVYARGMQLDGENFIRLFYDKNPELLSPLQFEMLDPNQICGYAYTATGGPVTTPYTQDGIERDDRGRELSYTIWVDRPGGGYEKVKIPARGEKSGRPFMLHGFVPEYSGQRRGYSKIGHAIQDFLNITDFEQAHVRKAINQSNLAFVSENKDITPGNPMPAFAGSAGRPISTLPDPSGNTEGLTCNLLPEATFTVPGSTMVIGARRGDTLKPVPNTAPADSFDKFIDAIMSYLSASAGMPIEVLKMQFGSNYSASRAAILLFWEVAKKARSEMAADFCNLIYQIWLAEEIAAGRVEAPGWYNPTMRAAWLSCKWAGQGAPDIDPVKTANAVRSRLEMGHTTNDRAAREYNGSEGASNRRALAREWEEYPLAPWLLLKAGQGPDDKNNEPEEV